MPASLRNPTPTRITGHNNQPGLGSIRGLVSSDANGLGETNMYARFPKLESATLSSPKLVYAAPVALAPNMREYRVGDVHNPTLCQYELPYYNEHPTQLQQQQQQQQQQRDQVLQQQQQRYRDVASSIGLARPEAWGVSMKHFWSHQPLALPNPMYSNSHVSLATTSSPVATQSLHRSQQPMVPPLPPVSLYNHDPLSSTVDTLQVTTHATSPQEIQAPLPQQPAVSSVITPRKDVGVIARPTWSQVTSGVKVSSTHAPATHRRSPSAGAVATTPPSDSIKPAARKLNRTLVAKNSPATQVPSSETDKTNGSEPALKAHKNNGVKLLSESLSYLCIQHPSSITSNRYPVVRLSNIPWTISIKEIESIFKDIKLPNPKDHAQSIHIIIDKTTGKTQPDAFVEVATQKDAEKAVKHHRNLPVKGRKLFIAHSSYEEMMIKLFPDWPGSFVNGKAIYEPSDMSMTTSNGASNRSPPLLLPRREIESLLGVCKNFKVHFSRKCGERPFENFISILVRFPWDQPNLITTMQRDHLYEYYKLATSVLKWHMDKPYVNLDRDLISRMIRAALQCPAFTVPQKKGILAAANMPCPPHMLSYLEVPTTPTLSEDA